MTSVKAPQRSVRDEERQDLRECHAAHSVTLILPPASRSPYGTADEHPGDRQQHADPAIVKRFIDLAGNPDAPS
jgi:hypothetical protein